MSNRLEQSPRRSPQRRPQRLKFLPVAETHENHENHEKIKAPTFELNAGMLQEDVSRTPLLEEEKSKLQPFNPQRKTSRLRTVLPQPQRYGNMLTSLPPLSSIPVMPSIPFTPTLSLSRDLADMQEVGTLPLMAIVLPKTPNANPQAQTLQITRVPTTDMIPISEKSATISEETAQEVSSQQEKQQPLVKQSELANAASNASFVGLGNVASYFFRYGSNFLIQRGLGAGLYGVFTFSSSVATLVASLFTFGLDNAMVRYIAIYNSRKQTSLLRGLTIFCTAIAGIAGIIGTLLVFFLAANIAHIFNRPAIIPVLQLLSPIIPLIILQAIWMNGLQGFKEFKRRVLIARIYVPSLGFAFLLITLIFFRNLTGFVIASVATTLLTVLFALALIFRKLSEAPVAEHQPDQYAVREWVSYATPNILTSIVDVVMTSMDTLLLGFFAVPFVAIGQYAAAIKVTAFIAMPLGSLNSIFAPTIAELYSKGEVQKLEEMFKIVTKWAITFSLPIFCVTTLFSASLLGLSGDSFISAWPLLIAFAVGGLVNAGTGSVGNMLLMTGHQRLSFLNSLAAILTNLVLGIILTPRYGAMGTAISTSTAFCVLNLMRLLQVRLFVKMQPYRWDMLKPLVAAAISTALTGGLLYLVRYTHFVVRISRFHFSIELALIPVLLVSYAAVLYLLKISPEDKIILDKFTNKMKRVAQR